MGNGGLDTEKVHSYIRGNVLLVCLLSKDEGVLK